MWPVEDLLSMGPGQSFPGCFVRSCMHNPLTWIGGEDAMVETIFHVFQLWDCDRIWPTRHHGMVGWHCISSETSLVDKQER